MATIIVQSVCIKCKTWTNTNQSYLILDLKPAFISVITEWISPENITETDHICQSCWEKALENIKVSPFNSNYTNPNIISDPLELKTEHSCSDDERLDNSDLHRAKKIKLEDDKDTTCDEHRENNYHNNEANQYKETFSRYDEVTSIKAHDNKLADVKEELLCADDKENDNHVNNTITIEEPVNVNNTITIEEPVNKYDEYIDIDYHDIATTNEQDPLIFDQSVENNCHTIKVTENNKTDHKSTGFNNITKTNEINNSSIIKQNLVKYGCMLCGLSVLKKQTEHTSSNEPVELIPTIYITSNSSAAKKSGVYRYCSNCINGKEKTVTKIGGPVKALADSVLVEESYKFITEQDQQALILKDSHNPSKGLQIITSKAKLTAIHTRADYDASKSNTCNEEVIEQTTLTESSQTANEDFQIRTSPAKLIEENANILIDSDASEFFDVEFLESDYNEDLHRNRAAASNNEQYTDDPEWEPTNNSYSKPKSAAIAKSSKPKRKEVITLQNYKRASINRKSRCIFSTQCSINFPQSMELNVRRKLLKDYKYYVPPYRKACLDHLTNNDWNEMISNSHSFSEFTAEQIEDLFSLLKSGKQLLSRINFDDISSIDDSVFQRWMGITREEFTVFVDKVPQVKKICRGMFGLAGLLIKYHTGKPNKKLVKIMHMPRRTLETKMKAVTEILNNNGIILEDVFSSIKPTEQQNSRAKKKSSPVSGSHKRTTKKKC